MIQKTADNYYICLCDTCKSGFGESVGEPGKVSNVSAVIKVLTEEKLKQMAKDCGWTFNKRSAICPKHKTK